MELLRIIPTECPVCGSRVQSEKQYSRHTCGDWNEDRIFECGCEIHFSPNFQRDEVKRLCPQHPEILTLRKNRKEARRKLVNYVNRLEVDDNFKTSLLRNINSYCSGDK